MKKYHIKQVKLNMLGSGCTLMLMSLLKMLLTRSIMPEANVILSNIPLFLLESITFCKKLTLFKDLGFQHMHICNLSMEI